MCLPQRQIPRTWCCLGTASHTGASSDVRDAKGFWWKAKSHFVKGMWLACIQRRWWVSVVCASKVAACKRGWQAPWWQAATCARSSAQKILTPEFTVPFRQPCYWQLNQNCLCLPTTNCLQDITRLRQHIHRPHHTHKVEGHERQGTEATPPQCARALGFHLTAA